MIIGILALQGAVAEHQAMLEQCNVESKLVKNNSDLENIAALIIPGGESTAIRKLLVRENMLETIKAMVKQGFPVFGTCAGLVLLSQPESLDGLENSNVCRNGFGRQKDSFEEELNFKGLDKPFLGIFIRAPYLCEVGDDVEVLAKTTDDRIVAAREKNILTTAFHPELTADPRIHQYFIEKIVKPAIITK